VLSALQNKSFNIIKQKIKKHNKQFELKIQEFQKLREIQ